MKKLLYLIILSLFISCKKEDSKNILFSTGTYFWYKNANGNNLLNSNLPNSINSSDIDVFVLRNGTKVRLFNSQMQNPENFKVTVSEDKGNLLYFYLDTETDSFTDNKVTMFIRYKDGSEDQITGEFSKKSKNDFALSKYWVNDNLKWEVNMGGISPSIIELIK